MTLSYFIQENERLLTWSTRWLNLANNTSRMTAKGNLQSTQDYVLHRYNIARKSRDALFKQWNTYKATPEGLAELEKFNQRRLIREA